MKHPVLTAEERRVFGKKVKKLRREGLLPSNVYGKGIKSQSLQVKLADFQTVYKEVGETGLIDLKVDGKALPVLIKNLQMDYAANLPLHADFYQVNLKEKVKAMVPIELVGEAKAVTEKVGVLLQTLSEVEVEALPDRIPESIEVNIENLAEVGAGINIGDIKAPEGVEILNEAGVGVVRIGEPAKEEPVEAPAEEAGAEAEAASEEGAKEEQTTQNNDSKKAE